MSIPMHTICLAATAALLLAACGGDGGTSGDSAVDTAGDVYEDRVILGPVRVD